MPIIPIIPSEYYYIWFVGFGVAFVVYAVVMKKSRKTNSLGIKRIIGMGGTMELVHISKEIESK